MTSEQQAALNKTKQNKTKQKMNKMIKEKISTSRGSQIQSVSSEHHWSINYL